MERGIQERIKKLYPKPRPDALKPVVQNNESTTNTDNNSLANQEVVNVEIPEEQNISQLFVPEYPHLHKKPLGYLLIKLIPPLLLGAIVGFGLAAMFLPSSETESLRFSGPILGFYALGVMIIAMIGYTTGKLTETITRQGSNRFTNISIAANIVLFLSEMSLEVYGLSMFLASKTYEQVMMNLPGVKLPFPILVLMAFSFSGAYLFAVIWATYQVTTDELKTEKSYREESAAKQRHERERINHDRTIQLQKLTQERKAQEKIANTADAERLLIEREKAQAARAKQQEDEVDRLITLKVDEMLGSEAGKRASTICQQITLNKGKVGDLESKVAHLRDRIELIPIIGLKPESRTKLRALRGAACIAAARAETAARHYHTVDELVG